MALGARQRTRGAGRVHVAARWIGKRVEIHPRFDRWMRGDKFGSVVGIRPVRGSGEVILKIRMDTSGQTVAFYQDDVTEVA